MPSCNMPFSSDTLSPFVPSIEVVFVYEVFDDYSCMCTVRIHNEWYKQRIALRDILSFQGQPTVDEKQRLFERLQDYMSFRNIKLYNLSYGDCGALLADVEVAGVHINSEINSSVGDLNRAIQKRHEESVRGRLERWLEHVVKRMREKLGKVREWGKQKMESVSARGRGSNENECGLKP